MSNSVSNSILEGLRGTMILRWEAHVSVRVKGYKDTEKVLSGEDEFAWSHNFKKAESVIKNRVLKTFQPLIKSGTIVAAFVDYISITSRVDKEV